MVMLKRDGGGGRDVVCLGWDRRRRVRLEPVLPLPGLCTSSCRFGSQWRVLTGSSDCTRFGVGQTPRLAILCSNSMTLTARSYGSMTPLCIPSNTTRKLQPEQTGNCKGINDNPQFMDTHKPPTKADARKNVCAVSNKQPETRIQKAPSPHARNTDPEQYINHQQNRHVPRRTFIQDRMNTTNKQTKNIGASIAKPENDKICTEENKKKSSYSY
ncbi:hypothetical protein FN846DRAFT_434678 [Sphaerosporella brunnea]|uniref:Uncharacterized protein n=1 Tax=Sphaerosporella brunnea TaxID=1250544 RepID=A0A5J5EGZ6_9PEZI|nr:hypothetical protein FN846DRAFT_434678 [Sphaerosporella brunnea]